MSIAIGKKTNLFMSRNKWMLSIFQLAHKIHKEDKTAWTTVANMRVLEFQQTKLSSNANLITRLITYITLS
jgi:hypothetical protein